MKDMFHALRCVNWSRHMQELYRSSTPTLKVIMYTHKLINCGTQQCSVQS